MSSRKTHDLIASAELFGFTASGRSSAARRGDKGAGQRADIDELQLLDTLNAPVETAAVDAPATDEDQATQAG